MTNKNTNENLVVVENVDTAGAITYWRLSGEVSLSALIDAWTTAELPSKLLPETPSDEVALRRALGAVESKRRLVRPLARRGIWAVVDELVDNQTQDLDHRTLVRVKLAKDGDTSRIVVEQVNADWATYTAIHDAIHNEFRRYKGVLSHQDISSWLVKLADKANAVSLRDMGGVYFVPRDKVEFWTKIAGALGELDQKVFRIPAMSNSEAVEAVLDAITAEAQREAEALEADLLKDGDEALGARALRGRATRCDAVKAKVESYERFLNVKLDDIRAKLDGLRANLAAAALAATATESDAA